MLNFWRRGCVLMANIERPAIKLHVRVWFFVLVPLFPACLLLFLVLFVVRLHVVFLLLLFLQAFLFCPSLLRGMLFNKFHFMRPVSEQHSSQFAFPRCPPPATLSAKIYLQLVLFVLGDANFKIRFCYSNGERNNKLQNETSKNSVDYELLWGS